MNTQKADKQSVLVIEDEATLALELCIRLEAEGYSVAGTASTGRQALALYTNLERVDLALCDINLRGDWTGIETARQLNYLRPVPIVYLSGLTDRTTVEQARQTNPAAYLIKPVSTDSLRIALEIALTNATQSKQTCPLNQLAAGTHEGENILQIDDHIFIKQNYHYIRLRQEDVLYIEANDKHTTVFTQSRKFVLRLSLSVLLQRLANIKLVRVHRSFAVNLSHVESFSDCEVQLPGQVVPLGRVYKEEFLHNFRHR